MIDRVDLLRASSTLSGIDFIQVTALTAPPRVALTLFFQHDALPAAVSAALDGLATQLDHIRVIGEGQADPATVTVLDYQLPPPAPIDGREVRRVTVAWPGGRGWYRLFLDSPVIDPYFNGTRFSFHAACDSELDCAPLPHGCVDESDVDFPVDYRARDFWSFRQALIDFAAQRYPDWQDRLEADTGMMVLELLAALGDEFAYAQDRLVREASLATATQRRSLRHLARLVDYRVDNGSGAFAWIDVQASADSSLDAGTVISDALQQVFFELGQGLRDTPLGAAPKAYAIKIARNTLQPYLWDESDTCLAAGSTTLTLQGAHAADLLPDPNFDPHGHWALLRTRPPTPDLPERRLAVRIIARHDAVDPLTGAAITQISWETPTPWELDLQTLVVRANLLPATSGRTQSTRFRIGEPSGPADPEPDLPRAIERLGCASTLGYPVPGSDEDDAARVKYLFPLPGSDTTPLAWLPVIATDGSTRMQPEVDLVGDADGRWAWLDALIGETTALPTEAAYTLEDGIYKRVVGFERLGRLTELVDYASGAGSTLRFGDGEFGRRPPEHAKFTLRWRLGNGSRMNVAPDTLTHFPAGVPAGVDASAGISNPLAAAGGADPEDAEQIRINAPQDFRTRSYRAVQAEDYAQMAERLPWVQKAGAAARWTGSWSTVFVTPDPRDAFGLSAGHRLDLERTLDRVRQAAREVKVRDPRYADIDLEIRLCVAPNAYRGEVKAATLAALFGPPPGQAPAAGTAPGGFFDPDHFSFGTPLSRAALIAALQGVPGVKAVEGMRVRRRGWFDWRDFTEYALKVGVDELVRVANDRNLSERGAVRLLMEGGA
ncbi:hypothetical protein RQP53_07700 [Paucibacter sp. APW11]|uniref:Baseplate protein J-like domain-containing protein n=1 Tax=Roseateles aquae TaxID=3077235 RepID=A0ABU3P9B8_9BURK|nr:hypothetical protein [Paucibacter sp. APW11]MDT8999149.1 hypothetical protein [Paucibacter sp. APW11]